MHRRLFGLGWLCCATLGAWQSTGLSPEMLNLARIKVEMEKNLLSLPNYTCLETMERSMRRAPSRKYQLVDTLRLEVAMVDGREMFAWPGAKKFEDRPLTEMVGTGGAIGNGTFGLLARAVFLSKAPSFEFLGEVERGGRKLLRYDFDVPQMLSGYSLRVVGRGEAITGFHGSFWADQATLDVQRLEIRADVIPPALELSLAGDNIEYRRVRIGERDVLLPSLAELFMVDLNGGESRNRIELSNCRQYTGESTLSFEEVPLKAPEAKASPEAIDVPAGLEIRARLETAVVGGRAAIGDPVTAVVESPVRKDRAVLIPKGAILAGRVTRIEKHMARREYYVVGMRFTSLRFDNAEADIDATVEDISLMSRTGSSLGDSNSAQRTTEPGTFFVMQNQLNLPRGMRFILRTGARPQEERK